MKKKFIVNIVIITFLMVPPAVLFCGETITVGHEDQDYNNIKEAIENAQDGDIIEIDDGIFTGPPNRSLNFMGLKITMTSKNGPEHTIIDCEHSAQAFVFVNGEGSDSILKNITIRNGGRQDAYGGGIYCKDSSPTIQNVYIENCTTNRCGGGIFCRNSSPTLKKVYIENCSAEVLGGGICIEGGSPFIDNCFIRECKAIHSQSSTIGRGGGISIRKESSPILINCAITYCEAIFGGGISIQNSSDVVIGGTMIARNRAHIYGGGLEIYECNNITFRSIHIHYNYAEIFGGGIDIIRSQVGLFKPSIHANEAEQAGGGISINGSVDRPAQLTIQYGWIDDNKAHDGGGIYIKYSEVTLTDVMAIAGNKNWAIYVADNTPIPIFLGTNNIWNNSPENFNW